MLGNSIEKKNENDIANIVKNPHNFIRKTKSYLKKNPNDLEKLHPDFSEEGKEGRERRKAYWVCGCFLPKSRYHSIFLRKLFQF